MTNVNTHRLCRQDHDAIPNAVLLCKLAPHWEGTRGLARIWQRPNGKLIVQVWEGGGLVGGWGRAKTRQAAGVMTRYIARQNLRSGQLLYGRFTRRIPSFGHTTALESEPCHFIAYADENRNEAVVYDLNGKTEIIDLFEPYYYRDGNTVWARIGDRWINACIQSEGPGNQYFISYEVEPSLNDRDGNTYVEKLVSADILLPSAVSVPCQPEARVDAFINGRWVRNCTYKSGSNEPGGVHTVITFWGRTRTATRVHPRITTASAAYRQAD
jgi:hypothetical protein